MLESSFTRRLPGLSGIAPDGRCASKMKSAVSSAFERRPASALVGSETALRAIQTSSAEAIIRLVRITPHISRRKDGRLAWTQLNLPWMGVISKALRIGEGRIRRESSDQLVEIERLISELSSESDQALQDRASELRERAGESSVEAIALAAVASERTIGLRPFPVQLIGAATLAAGRIAEMKTGEGKTLTAALALFAASLKGRGAHLITVNDYLARRDAEWMRPIYELLGAEVGVIQNKSTRSERQLAWAADITYASNSELGFDYLRDHLVKNASERVLRAGDPRHFVIVDEADSILIDEARVPLIISGNAKESDSELLGRLTRIVRSMRAFEHGPNDSKLTPERRIEIAEEYDYEFDKKWKTASPTERGVARFESELGIKNLYLAQHGEIVNAVMQALKAEALYEREVDYTVIDGEVKIIDEFTGRVLDDRQWSDGLHQAVEAKEGLKIKAETLTQATITYQNLFREYETLSGMTGTALTEAVELKKIYGVDVVEIPTNLPVERIDQPDLLFVSKAGKWAALVDKIIEEQKRGRPILVGTTSVEDSELLSERLSAASVEHVVLNAKPEHAEREGEIITEAGRPGRVTVATNMAGRGVDIKLGGDPEALHARWLGSLSKSRRKRFTESELQERLRSAQQESERERELVLATGGLLVLGSERHDARRIDNQLRGRSGRQGDPGESQFFISAEDELLRVFGGPKLRSILEKLSPVAADGSEIGLSSRVIAKRVDKAQRTVEEQNYLVRKKILEYDDVLSSQRKTIWDWRDRVLEGEDVSDVVERGLSEMIADRALALIPADQPEPDHAALARELGQISDQLALILTDPGEAGDVRDTGELIEALQGEILELREDERDRLGEKVFSKLERWLLLHVVDTHWPDHISKMEALRDGVTLRAPAQINPLVAYKNDGHDLFGEFVTDSWDEFARYLFHVRVLSPEEVAAES